MFLQEWDTDQNLWKTVRSRRQTWWHVFWVLALLSSSLRAEMDTMIRKSEEPSCWSLNASPGSSTLLPILESNRHPWTNQWFSSTTLLIYELDTQTMLTLIFSSVCQGNDLFCALLVGKWGPWNQHAFKRSAGHEKERYTLSPGVSRATKNRKLPKRRVLWLRWWKIGTTRSTLSERTDCSVVFDLFSKIIDGWNEQSGYNL